ncbi:MAG TPA: elongation factor G [Gaiellales bacterium]|jgi:elongation factor G|nr:elongation factor G [Gaiellales bacterium]
MPHKEPGKIRNVAVIGHRGTGKTSLVEALLYESGTINRLGSVAENSTIADYDDDERKRGMSISAAVTHLEWEGRTINLIDTPGEPSFQADVLSALRVVEGAIVTVSGVLGVEVGTERLWRRCDELGTSRLVLVNLLDRERADFFTALGQLQERLSDKCVAVEIPIGSEGDFHGVVDLVHMVAYLHGEDAAGHDESVPIPDDLTALAEEYHDKLMDVVAETSDELMERYLEGGEITREEMAQALKQLVTDGQVFPVGCGAATRNIGSHGLLDLIVEGLPSPARARNVPESGGASTVAYVFKTIADPYSGKISLMRVFAGTLKADSQLVNSRTHGKERIGQLLLVQGKDHTPVDELGPGMIGAVAKLKETNTGDVLADVDAPAPVEPITLPPPVVSFAIEARSKGDEDKVHASLRRLQEEDPSLDVHRDEETGETIVAGLSQMHVETVLDRMQRRFGVEVDLHPPRVPYRETIRKAARAHGRHKKQTGGRGQFGDCHIEIEPMEGHEGYEFVDKIVGGVIPQGFRPAVDKGIQEAMRKGELVGAPVVGVRVRLVDGSYHNVDSSEMAFKIAGSLAFKQAVAQADPVLLEPIMRLDITVPDENVGDVIGDMSSRRGRVLGMDPGAGTTVVHVEVPMAEVLAYAQDLTSMTGGRGDYSQQILRYEEVPPHAAQAVIAAAQRDREMVKA